MVEILNSIILLALIVAMISGLGVLFFVAYEWSDIGMFGKAMVVAVQGPVEDEEEAESVERQPGQGMVLGVQSIRPVDFVNYPVVYVASGLPNVFVVAPEKINTLPIEPLVGLQR